MFYNISVLEYCYNKPLPISDANNTDHKVLCRTGAIPYPYQKCYDELAYGTEGDLNTESGFDLSET